ncbi:MAG: hypothetical protein WCC54_16585 [Pseudolabrys sp.]
MHAPVLLYLYIRIRDALINFDVLMTEGFGLEVDGRMKGGIQEEAQKSAENLKARYLLLQVKVYDAAAHTRTRVQLPTGKATIPIDE